MIDRDKIRDKIAFIRGNVEMLRRLAGTPRDGFTERSAEFHAAVRLVQISIEAMIDIGNHIVAREAIGSPKSYGEVFDLLSGAGLLPSDYLERAKAMVRFRNRAVHLYGDINVEHVYSLLQDHLGDFDRFIGLIAHKYLN